MDKSTLKRLNALRKKLRRWEKEGYDVSPLRKDIEAFERQEGIVRRSKAPMVVLITFLVLAVIGGGISIGIRYAPSGLTYLRTNSRGYKEYKNKKDGSILIYIPAGEFTMGSENGNSNEKPVHKVYLDGYYIGKYEVTVAQFRRFVEATGYKTDAEKSGGGLVYVKGGWVEKTDANWRNPYFSQTDNDPVVLVSWNDAVAYCKWAGLRLPTEAEWEKAARGGEDYKYAGSNNPDEVAWYDNNSGAHTHPVGQKKPNGYGIYDMSGNVREWCSDWYGEHYYRDSPYRNPKGPDSGSCRVDRGGSWFGCGGFLCCSGRFRFTPVDRYNILGFRVGRSP